MSNTLSKIKTGLLLMAGALLLVTTPATAGFAQGGYSGNGNAQMSGRLDQLENQMQTLNRAVYKGGPVPAPSGDSDATSGALSNYEVRLSQIESQVRDLTGRLEQMTHDIQTNKDRMDKLAADTEMRFQQQGSGGAVTGNSSGGSSSSTPVGPPAPATDTTPEVKGDLYATSGNSTTKTLGTLSQSGASADQASVLYESAFADIRAAKYDDAEKKFKDFMAKYPSHALAGNAQYWLAETYYVRGNYDQAAKMFAQCYQDYPQGQKASDSLLKLGLSLGKLGKKDDACLSFAQLKKQFPGESSTVGARAQQEMKQLGCK